MQHYFHHSINAALFLSLSVQRYFYHFVSAALFFIIVSVQRNFYHSISAALFLSFPQCSVIYHPFSGALLLSFYQYSVIFISALMKFDSAALYIALHCQISSAALRKILHGCFWPLRYSIYENTKRCPILWYQCWQCDGGLFVLSPAGQMDKVLALSVCPSVYPVRANN